MTLLVDECVDSSITSALRKGRHQIITLGDLGLINIKFQDPDVLAQANALTASVLTFNVNHFTELFRQGLAQRSVVLLRKPRWMEVDPFLMLIYDELELCQQEPTRITRIGFGLTPPRPYSRSPVRHSACYLPTMYRFAIIGLGKIARKFAADLKLVEGATLESVASRSQARADAFAQEFGARYAAGTYEELFEGPYLHVVYIATPHPDHVRLAEICLERGLAVICEKPLGMNYAEVDRLVSLARKRKVYLLEALWTRFLPSFQAAKSRIDGGAIGKIEGLRADFGFKLSDGSAPRITELSLGAGALLDIGIYPVFLAQVLLGEPSEITAVARLDENGVDVDDTIVLRYPGGQVASLHCTLLARTKTEAVVYGSAGTLFWDGLWYQQSNFTIVPDDGEEERRYVAKARGAGYAFEAQAVVEDLRAKRTESELWSLDDTLLLHRTLTEIRLQIGLRYPVDA